MPEPGGRLGADEREALAAALLAQRLNLTGRLRQRRFELLATSGPGALFAEVQGRAPGESTAPSELAELISSIASVGVLQPVLVEELPGPVMRLVAGERRMRSVHWGARHHPDNPHFAALPAVVCPGPLSEEERRVWQLVENLAREDLQPGELAAALLFERAAVLAAKLSAAGVVVPIDDANLDDPVARFRALDRVRVAAGCHHLGAPWDEVLRRVGIQVRPEKAKVLVRAFAAMPVELSAEMDAAKIALATRLEYLRLVAAADLSRCSAEEQEVLLGPRHLPPTPEVWEADIPLVLVDTYYEPLGDLSRPQGRPEEPNLIWLCPADEADLLTSLADAGVLVVSELD